jgi:hypothetical protein
MTETTPSMKKEISIPENMQLNELSDKLEFEYKWFKPKYIISLIAAPVFAFFLIKSDFIMGDFDLLTTPVTILILLSCLTIYYSIAKLINTTKIHVTHDELNVHHGPVPFSKNLHLTKGDITQLYVTQHRIGHQLLFVFDHVSDQCHSKVKRSYNPCKGIAYSGAGKVY